MPRALPQYGIGVKRANIPTIDQVQDELSILTPKVLKTSYNRIVPVASRRLPNPLVEKTERLSAILKIKRFPIDRFWSNFLNNFIVF
jgi:hypothetical protein